MRRRDSLLSAAAPAVPQDLREIARVHVDIAVGHQGSAKIWGRLGGAAAEHDSATCYGLRSFCLMNSPPYYHTDHDTIDKISAAGIANAVRFHWRLLERLKEIR